MSLSGVQENSTSYILYQPMRRIKNEQRHVERQVTSLLCQSDVIMLCPISAHS